MKISLEVINAALELADLSKDDLRLDYPGKGMYGKVCPGLTVENLSDFALFMYSLGVVAAGEGTDVEGEGFQMARNTGADDMGRGTIFYWQQLVVVED